MPLEEDVLQAICDIAREELEVTAPLLPDEGLLEALALDSLRLTVLVVGLENRFRVLLCAEDAQDITTPRDLARRVAARIHQSRSLETPVASQT